MLPSEFGSETVAVFSLYAWPHSTNHVVTLHYLIKNVATSVSFSQSLGGINIGHAKGANSSAFAMTSSLMS